METRPPRNSASSAAAINLRMGKFGFDLHRSPEKCDPGNGLFSRSGTPAGTRVPAKGPWFDIIEKAQTWMRTLHPASQGQMLNRIIELYCKCANGDASQPAKPMYKVLTGIVGFVNDNHKISRKPNAELEVNPDAPLGEHTIQMRIVSPIKETAKF